MADYWKSQPRKFCQYCKCWIADNKPSVEFHERGKNHKENVAAKISEIKKKSIDKAKQEEKQCKAFAAMEEAAMKAYQEDLKRMEREAAGLPPEVTPAIPTTPKPPPLVVNVTKEEWKKQQKKAKAGKKPGNQTQGQVWVEGRTDDGHTYYYNTVTGESQWENPWGGPATTQPPQTQSSSRGIWLEATSPEGYTYYYNTDSGESSWEKPADYQSHQASGSNNEGEGEQVEEPEPPQAEPLTGGEKSSSGVPASQETDVQEQANKKSNVPKISFRKRKAEAEPSEKEKEDKASDDAPKDDPAEVRKEEEEQTTTAAPEEKKEKVTQAKKPKTSNPYGSWEKIQEEEDPYASVDLQLPQVEGSGSDAADELPPEPKPKFKERVITSLGDEGGPASFRKTKTQNGKSRSIRQRDDDD